MNAFHKAIGDQKEGSRADCGFGTDRTAIPNVQTDAASLSGRVIENFGR